MNTWVIACFIVFSEGCRANQEDGVVASTKFGNVIGFTEKTEDGFEADVFLGIPYAQPPIGENRFEKPKPVNPWKPETIVAKKLAPSCIPTSKFFLKQLANYSEDCLFLNIMTPKKRSSELLPVFVFIHGGAFVIGTPEIYGYDKPVDNFVRHEIVYVTLAYRLGPFGFFSTGDDTMPGNLGLWDQSQALRFLHEILPDFGGDPNRITLSGHSAGSASVSAHLFSPHSNQLFERASQFSGSLFAEWAINENVVENSKNLAKELKCEMSSSKSIHECIKSKPLDAILEILDKQPPFLKSPRLTAFSPRFDRDFFPNQFDELIRKAPKKATLNFVTNLESGGAVKKEMWKTYKKEDLICYIRDYVSVEHELGRRSSPLLIELLDYYVNRDEKEEPSYYMTRQCELLSDLQFNVPILHEVELKQEHGWDTYLVVMDYESEPMRDKESPIRGWQLAQNSVDFSDPPQQTFNQTKEKY
ncbi:hypothetical protein WR25_05636 [Diploscapter pachys]|uniref:Carboxylic ester hydrolase n=1 Tax=Diploscapter pachys TaxID=2018661 RepID=A0A2A2JR17_9BILA|nr:hypothetical protein WR25_05636 [Diploscapter pachys]